jgi:hypothetical protein
MCGGQRQWVHGLRAAVTERRTRADWAHFGRAIAGAYPDAERITLVMDNLNTHSAASLYDPAGLAIQYLFAREKRLDLWERLTTITERGINSPAWHGESRPTATCDDRLCSWIGISVWIR